MVQHKLIFIVLIFIVQTAFAQQKYGANIPWITYEAENMHTNGTVLGPAYDPYRVETESSGQQCVKLDSNSQYVQLSAKAKANSIVIRYSLPDNKDGNGTNSTFGIYINKKYSGRYKITSHYAWLYGKYPFTNDPGAGVPRHFYDEVRIKNIKIVKGDIVQIKREDQKGNDANYVIVDLVDLENIAPPLQQPPNSLSVTDANFTGNGFKGDYTQAFINCIAKAVKTGKSVWIPAGEFKITGDIVLPSNIIIQGAGMWYSTLTGDSALYHNPNRRVRIKGSGSNIHLSDFAVNGKLTYRNDRESSDGIVGSYGENSTISNLWIEHTKVGMWIENSKNLSITGCRMRNTLADGINFCVGMRQSTIQNCSARGTGDDCFAIWPTVFMKQVYFPGHNLIVNCTGQLPYLANGGAIYGGDSNEIKDCLFTDISQGSAILISTTFPTESRDKTINNNFSGITIIEGCLIKNSGGFDHEWDWRAAVEVCLDKRSISGLELKNLDIQNSLSNGISVVAKNADGKIGVLANSALDNVHVSNYGIGVKNKHGLFISNAAHGSLALANSKIGGIQNESVYFSITKN